MYVVSPGVPDEDYVEEWVISVLDYFARRNLDWSIPFHSHREVSCRGSAHLTRVVHPLSGSFTDRFVKVGGGVRGPTWWKRSTNVNIWPIR